MTKRTTAELIAKLEADPRFRKSTKPGEGVIMLGGRPDGDAIEEDREAEAKKRQEGSVQEGRSR
jgi:hypothetical protein